MTSERWIVKKLSVLKLMLTGTVKVEGGESVDHCVKGTGEVSLTSCSKGPLNHKPDQVEELGDDQNEAISHAPFQGLSEESQSQVDQQQTDNAVSKPQNKTTPSQLAVDDRPLTHYLPTLDASDGILNDSKMSVFQVTHDRQLPTLDDPTLGIPWFNDFKVSVPDRKLAESTNQPQAEHQPIFNFIVKNPIDPTYQCPTVDSTPGKSRADQMSSPMSSPTTEQQASHSALGS